jgi:hypothetical protein
MLHALLAHGRTHVSDTNPLPGQRCTDRVFSLGAAGFRDNATQSGFTADTRFHVGSVTKSLLSTGLLRLAITGAIELDAPVARYLPDLPFDRQTHHLSRRFRNRKNYCGFGPGPDHGFRIPIWVTQFLG